MSIRFSMCECVCVSAHSPNSQIIITPYLSTSATRLENVRTRKLWSLWPATPHREGALSKMYTARYASDQRTAMRALSASVHGI